MAFSPELASAAFGLTSAALWGAGDFSGGLVTKRANVFGVTLVSQTIGLVLMVGLALLRQEAMPSASSLLVGCAAGISGGIGVAAFYRALAVGQMGVAAPVAAVGTAAIPVPVGLVTQGMPGTAKVVGFGLALLGVWLLSRPERTGGRPQGLGLAVLAGFGFGGFLTLVAMTHTTAVFWPLVAARSASVVMMLVVVLATQRGRWQPKASTMPLVVAAGVLDVAGNAFYLLATQSGRLDVAAVLSSLYPASTVILASVIIKERITRTQLLGLLMALVAIPLITVRDRQ